MKTKKNNVIAILVILALLALIVIAVVLMAGKKKDATVELQEKQIEQSMVIEDGTEQEVNDAKEGVFRQSSHEKQKNTNADVKGGSETLEIIKPEEEKSSEEDAEQNREDSMLLGIW